MGPKLFPCPWGSQKIPLTKWWNFPAGERLLIARVDSWFVLFLSYRVLKGGGVQGEGVTGEP